MMIYGLLVVSLVLCMGSAEASINKMKRRCKDKLEKGSCEFYLKTGYCKFRPERLSQICPYTCDLCDYGRPESLWTRVKKHQCTDKDGPFNCRHLKKNGACQSHPSLMTDRCAKTCSLCAVQEQCKAVKCPSNKICGLDENSKTGVGCKCVNYCPLKREYRKLGKVCASNGRTYKDYCHMLHHKCRGDLNITVAYYGNCPGDAPCEDREAERRSGFCKSWKNLGLCKQGPYMDTMKKYCKKTCAMCPQKRVPFPQKSCHSSPWGCCWDWTDKPAPNFPNQCRECKDKYPELCKSFIMECSSTYYQHQPFMKLNCPQTCGFCVNDNRKFKIKIFSENGRRLSHTYMS